MTQLDLSPDPFEDPPPIGWRMWVVYILASLVTMAAFLAAMLLGAAYFETRRYSTHIARMERVLAQSPNVEQVDAGLAADGSPLVAKPKTETQLQALLDERYFGKRREEVEAKHRRWPSTRVYRAGDMLYFVYFDESGTMRDFACLSW